MDEEITQIGPLVVEDQIVKCQDDELAPFTSHPSHSVILRMPGNDVVLRDFKELPKPFGNPPKYDLRIVESLLVQSRYF